MLKYFDIQSLVVIVVTMALFVIALFVKGITHDLLLEAGVLLVSIKLIMMAYKNTQNYNIIKKDLEEIKNLIKDMKQDIK